MREYKIYCLKHPQTQEIRYIGVTSRKLLIRLKDHINQANKINKTKNHRWLLSLESEPIIEVLKTTNCCEQASIIEKETIREYITNGFNLNNHADGGYLTKERTYIPKDKLRKKVDMYTLEGVYIKTFDSIKDAEVETNTNNSKITSCCQGGRGRRTANGYIWRYNGEELHSKPVLGQYKLRKVNQYTLNGEYIKTWNSISEFYKDRGVKIGGKLSKACNDKTKAFGYLWRYENDEF
jgi:CTP synthase (UTP-ammonia lyase)